MAAKGNAGANTDTWKENGIMMTMEKDMLDCSEMFELYMEVIKEKREKELEYLIPDKKENK